MSEKALSTTGSVGIIDFAELPRGTETLIVPVIATDGAGSLGALYRCGGEKTVVVAAHPRSDFSRHYAAPEFLSAGYAFYGHQTRSLNNDLHMEHERLLLDLAAAMVLLRGDYGFEKVVLLGNSGGASLMAFYQQQAVAGPSGRLTDTAAGDPLDLNAVDMPKADGVVLLAAHPGQGSFMLTAIDPSVVEEGDPVSVDPELDMYDPDNGFNELPAASTYSEEFLERYRAAQRARVARLDARARELIDEQRRNQAKMAEEGFSELPLRERQHIARRASSTRFMTVFRTEADPSYVDLDLHSWKSTRKPGSILGPRPDEINYAADGFGRLTTPRAWLSTWSGLSTRAKLLTSVESICEPLLIVNYTQDNLCFPDDNHGQFHASPAEDKTMEYVDCDHFGLPIDQREIALKIVTRWLADRFPQRLTPTQSSRRGHS